MCATEALASISQTIALDQLLTHTYGAFDTIRGTQKAKATK